MSANEAASETGKNDWSTMSSVLGVFVSAAAGCGHHFAQHMPIDDVLVRDFSSAVSKLSVVCKLAFSGTQYLAELPSENRWSRESWKVGDARATGALIGAVTVVFALFPTCWHFHELSGQPAGEERSVAIVGEVYNMCGYFAQVGYAAAVNDSNPESKVLKIGFMTVNNVAGAGLQAAMAAI